MTRKKLLKSMIAMTLVVLLCCTFVIPSFALDYGWRARMIDWGTFQQGSNAGPVRVIQRYMLCYNTLTAYYAYIGGGVDGIFGANTANAVRSFQSSEGLSVDGIVGQNSWGKMAEDLSDTGRIVYKPDYCYGNAGVGFSNINGNIWHHETGLFEIFPCTTNGAGTAGSFVG